MTTQQIEKIGLIAGEGELPVHVAKTARQDGLSVVPFCLSRENRDALAKVCDGPLHKISPGLVETTLRLMKKEAVHHVVFAGKVNKWLLLQDPRLDHRAIVFLNAFKNTQNLNDDTVMLGIIEELQKEGIHVLSQTDFLQELFVPEGIFSTRQPDEQAWLDIAYGYKLAKEMGRLDVGQTVVVRDTMTLAVEAIEGTDNCLKRAGDVGKKKGGVVIKVEKPLQDNRFDVPTVGLQTLKTMKSAGLKVLATEAGKTLYLDLPQMIEFANRHDLTLVSYNPQQQDG